VSRPLKTSPALSATTQSSGLFYEGRASTIQAGAISFGPMRDLVSTYSHQTHAQRQNSCPCLNGGEVFFVGYSELRHIVDAVLEGLTCTDEDAGMYENHILCSTNKRLVAHFGHVMKGLARGHRGMRDSLCREAVYSQRPYGARCQGAGYDLRLRYEWKSFQASARDVVHRKRVLAAAARGGRVLVVLSGGLHDMTSFRAITEQQRKAMPSSMRWPQEGWLGLQPPDSDPKPDLTLTRWPQEWIDHYVNGTMALFDFYGRKNLPDNVCVVYRGSNVATREAGRVPSQVARLGKAYAVNQNRFSLEENEEFFHPSVVGGLSDWLNKLAFALAPQYGIRTIDQTAITLKRKPFLGDVFHGYPDGILANDLLSQACRACAGFPSKCSLPIPAGAGAPPCSEGAPPPCKANSSLPSRARSPFRADKRNITAINFTALTEFKGWNMSVVVRPGDEPVMKFTCPLPCVGPHVPGYSQMGTELN
jgi:hypothetical protein